MLKNKKNGENICDNPNINLLEFGVDHLLNRKEVVGLCETSSIRGDQHFVHGHQITSLTYKNYKKLVMTSITLFVNMDEK